MRVLLRWVGQDVSAAGVLETPRRVIDALAEMTSGGESDAAAILATRFDEPAYAGPVILRGIGFSSLCEHHLLPFVGRALVAYEPKAGRVVGLSKLARLIDVYAHRLQLQERLTCQVALAIEEHLKPAGVAVLMRAEHACMQCRGARKDAEMITAHCLGSYLRPGAQAELVALL